MDLEMLKDRARNGDTNAQYEVGQRYLNGIGISPSLVTAIEWFTKAAQENHAQAQYALSAYWLSKAEENGYMLRPPHRRQTTNRIPPILKQINPKD